MTTVIHKCFRYIPEHKVQTNYGPFSRYYVQQDLDEGHLITTTIPVADVSFRDHKPQTFFK
ncbi:hypothetical protein DPMN_171240 [Dreissena polymorpha]|uniref:Uncharacterized protein n=1 Tax=Dreissena polymorpha TaxID=45954 RepID=A0A9D4DZZ6_DREPO|nr:hypothetical protein DPMN_171240 [Dreissena polymorpha]